LPFSQPWGIIDPHRRYANLAATAHDRNLIGLDVAADRVDVDTEPFGDRGEGQQLSVAHIGDSLTCA